MQGSVRAERRLETRKEKFLKVLAFSFKSYHRAQASSLLVFCYVCVLLFVVLLEITRFGENVVIALRVSLKKYIDTSVKIMQFAWYIIRPSEYVTKENCP